MQIKEPPYIFLRICVYCNHERSESMAKENINFKLDENIKNDMESACSEIVISMSTAFTIFAEKVARERRIPFEISADPFYSESNISHLKRGIAALNAGEGVEHELIEVTD